MISLSDIVPGDMLAYREPDSPITVTVFIIAIVGDYQVNELLPQPSNHTTERWAYVCLRSYYAGRPHQHTRDYWCWVSQHYIEGCIVWMKDESSELDH